MLTCLSLTGQAQLLEERRKLEQADQKLVKLRAQLDARTTGADTQGTASGPFARLPASNNDDRLLARACPRQSQALQDRQAHRPQWAVCTSLTLPTCPARIRWGRHRKHFAQAALHGGQGGQHDAACQE